MDADQLIKKMPKKRVVLKEIKIIPPEERLPEITERVIKDLKTNQTICDSTLIEFIRANQKLLIDNGWVHCLMTGHFIPKSVAAEVYRSYADFKAGKVSHIYSYYDNKNYVMIDTLLEAKLTDRNCSKVYVDGKEHLLNESHKEHLIAQGKVHQYYARVNRNTKVWTDFHHRYYDNKKAPKDWEIPAGQTYGIEIEVNFANALDKLKFSRDLYEVLPDWYCERDGSLEDYDSNSNHGLGGLEIISAPLNFSDLVDKAKIVCNLLNKYNAKAYQAGEYFGLHVTHSLEFDDSGTVNKKQGWNYLRYINDPKLREFWRCIARRRPNKFCVFIDDFIGNYGTNPKLNNLTRAASENNHHLAACVRDSQKAIETRIFCSTKGTKTLEATLEIIKLTSEYSKKDFDLKGYSDFITENSSRNLASFLKSRGALYCLDAMCVEDYDDTKEDF
jgi:hypothetical protein